MALNRVEKEVGVTVKVDAGGAIRAWREYEKATAGAASSTKKFGDGLDASNARIQNQQDALKKAIATFDRAAASQAKATAGMKSGLQGLGPLASVAAGAIGGMGITALAGAAMNAAQKMSELSDESLKTQNVFNNLAFAIAPASKATKGFISDMELATFANQAAAIGITDTSAEFANFAGAVQKLAARAGTDTEQMFNSMIAAVGRGSTEMLDNAGIVLKVDQAHELYAKQLGKTKKELTETEEAEAFRKVAMQKIFEAAEDITIATDGAAAATKRYKVELDNLKTAAMGGEDKVTSLREGYKRLEETQSIATLGLHGQRMEFGKLRDALIAAGVETEKVAKLTNADLANGIARARHEEEQRLFTLASEGKLTSEYRSELERAVDRMDKSAIAAQHLARALEQIRVADAAQSMEDLNAQLNIQIGLQAQLDNAAMVDAEIGSGGGGKGGGRRDKFARQRAEFEAALADSQRSAGFDAVNRDEMTARGEFDSQLGIAQRNQAIADAQAQHNAIMEAGEKEHLKKMEEARKAAHDAHLKRIADEKKAREEAIRHQQQVQAVVGSLAQQSMGLAEQVAVSVAGSERKRTMIMQGFAASQATAIGVMETVKAAAAFASLNFVQGAAHTGAAALAYAKAGLLAGGVIGPGAGGGGGAGIGGGGSSSIPGSGGGSSRSAPEQSAPISRKGEQHTPPTASGGGGFNGTINFNSYFPADEEKAGNMIRRLANHSGESFGSMR